MLSIAEMSGTGAGLYYSNLAREDYYTNGGEPPGKWFGEGARMLGLGERVERADFRTLLDGYSPDGERRLVQNAGKEDRQSGWDLTFSPPKSVSVVWACVDQALSMEIVRAHHQAVEAVLGDLERTALFTRRGKAGSRQEPAGMVAAIFEHGTSRAQDPQLHSHALILNVGIREDGTTGTILSRPLYERKMMAGEEYRRGFGARLEQIGFSILWREKHEFEIAGVPQALCEEFSKRRAAIEKYLAEHGLSSAVAAKIAALETREAKQVRPRRELLESWRGTAREYGFGAREIDQLLAGKERETMSLETAGSVSDGRAVKVPELEPPANYIPGGPPATIPALVNEAVPSVESLAQPIAVQALPEGGENPLRRQDLPQTPSQGSERDPQPPTLRQTDHVQTPAQPRDEPSARDARSDVTLASYPDAVSQIRPGVAAERESRFEQHAREERFVLRGAVRTVGRTDQERLAAPEAERRAPRGRSDRPGSWLPPWGIRLARIPWTPFEVRVVPKLLFPRAPSWSPVRDLWLPRLRVTRQFERKPPFLRWLSDPLKTKSIGPIELQLREKVVFKRAPLWSPVYGLKTKVVTVEVKQPSWAKAIRSFFEPHAQKVKREYMESAREREREREHGRER